jgi:hypothetical protein
MIYDCDGKFLDSWGESKFSYRTHGMFMRNGVEMFLVDDGGNSVGKYSLDGTLIQTIGPAGVRSDTGYDGSDFETITHGGPPYNRPTNLASSPSGELYVSDGYGNCRVHRFKDDGTFVGSWGEPGTGPGQFNLPHSTWVHTDGRVLVADRQNDRIQIFDSEGPICRNGRMCSDPKISSSPMTVSCSSLNLCGERANARVAEGQFFPKSHPD